MVFQAWYYFSKLTTQNIKDKMSFIPVSINAYVKKHLMNNPSENDKDLRNLNSALADYKKGIKCSCGNDLWVVGSASVGNSCFTCLTGENYPIDDYEIESAINKSENVMGRKHINKIPPSKIRGFFNDDGYEINTDLIKKPSLCITCINDDNPNEKMFCDMTRYDQKDDEEFKCFAYKARKT
jgi:hypothetical protein